MISWCSSTHDGDNHEGIILVHTIADSWSLYIVIFYFSKSMPFPNVVKYMVHPWCHAIHDGATRVLYSRLSTYMRCDRPTYRVKRPTDPSTEVRTDTHTVGRTDDSQYVRLVIAWCRVRERELNTERTLAGITTEWITMGLTDRPSDGRTYGGIQSQLWGLSDCGKVAWMLVAVVGFRLDPVGVHEYYLMSTTITVVVTPTTSSSEPKKGRWTFCSAVTAWR